MNKKLILVILIILVLLAGGAISFYYYNKSKPYKPYFDLTKRFVPLSEGEYKIGTIPSGDRLIGFSPDGYHFAYKNSPETKPGFIRKTVFLCISGKIKSPLICKPAIKFYKLFNPNYVGVDNEKIGTYELTSQYIFSPDSQHFAFKASEGGKKFYVIDGQEKKRYDNVDQFVFSQDGNHFAYSANLGEEDFIVFDDQEKKRYDFVVHPTFSPDSQHFAYIASQEFPSGDEFIVFDDKEKEPHKIVQYPTFSPDSQHFLYVASIDKGESIVGKSVILDGQRKEIYSDLMEPVFSPDSKHIAYAAREIDDTESEYKDFIIIDDRIEKEINFCTSKPCSYDNTFFLNSPIFSPDSNRFAYKVREPKEMTESLILDKKPYPKREIGYYRNFSFSPDSQHFAYIASEWVGKEFSNFVVIDSHEGNKYNRFPETVIFSPDSQHYAYLVKDEKCPFIVLDNKEIKGYDAVYNPQFSSDSKYLIYNALEENIVYRVVEKIGP